MDALDLARLQFATTVGLHWLFVMFTLGLAPLVAILHTRYALTGKPVLERMTRFWGQLYVINYVLGIVTGLVMEFQFGLSWSGLSKFAGNVFGAPLALEALIAFFAESTFLGMWIFGWGKLPAKLHASLIWLVTLTAYASAYWILVANGFMQNPVGYEIREGAGGARAYLSDLGAQLTNPSAMWALGHICGAAVLAGGLVVAGVSAYHIRKRTAETDFFRRSLRLGVLTATVGGFFAQGLGHAQEGFVREVQPVKFAGPEEADRIQAQMAAAHGPGDYIPPGWIDGAYALMFPFGELLAVGMLVYAVLLIRGWIFSRPMALRSLTLLIPVPFVTALAGWIFREVGRQPWIIYGELTVEGAVAGEYGDHAGFPHRLHRGLSRPLPGQLDLADPIRPPRARGDAARDPAAPRRGGGRRTGPHILRTRSPETHELGNRLAGTAGTVAGRVLHPWRLRLRRTATAPFSEPGGGRPPVDTGRPRPLLPRQ